MGKVNINMSTWIWLVEMPCRKQFKCRIRCSWQEAPTLMGNPGEQHGGMCIFEALSEITVMVIVVVDIIC